MSDVTILYLADYKHDEEIVMRSAGVNTLRLSLPDDLQALDVAPTKAPFFVRGPRMDERAYERFWKIAVEAGLDIVTSPGSYRIISSFELYYPLLQDLSPHAVVLDASATSQEVLRRAISSGLRFPLFFRSEVESAAKYVGIEGCIVREALLAQVELVLGNLRRVVHGFRTIIVKEKLPVAVGAKGLPLEYRAIGARGRLVAFDYDREQARIIPSLTDLGLEREAAKAFQALARGEASGAAFVDLAVVEGGKLIVVECKDFLNGSIAHPREIAVGLLNWRSS